ncbi:acyloxyacyl hydrolase [Microbulbifer sediminum]|uniref:acyloxyacyl hydrolase n=1 Tax=Microbulbifer sediminum TaxID=2904250 RepID=UPI001F2537B0|nr:acyloxyacyl hydrolase [Microbulbifer sediminum]
MRAIPPAIILSATVLSSPALADQEFILSIGKGLDSLLIQRESIASAEMAGFSYAHDFAEFPFRSGLWQWWVQGSYSHLWEQHLGEDQHQEIFELKPVLRWYPGGNHNGFFAEAGVGAAYLTHKSFGDIELTTKPNFALHFVGGYRLPGGCSMSVRYSHFSNAYTNTPNPGFDFASINWHFSF